MTGIGRETVLNSCPVCGHTTAAPQHLKGRHWTVEEDKFVIDSIRSGVPAKVIARRMGCSVDGINYRIHRIYRLRKELVCQ